MSRQVLTIFLLINVTFHSRTISGFPVMPSTTSLPSSNNILSTSRTKSSLYMFDMFSDIDGDIKNMNFDFFSNTDGDAKNSNNVKKTENSNEIIYKSPKIIKIESSEDYINFLKEDDRICVIKFYAPWCKSCQKMGVKFRNMAKKEGDIISTKSQELIKTGRVRFAEIEFSSNAPLCRSLGIKRLPYVNLHKGEMGQLAAFPCGPSKFPILESKLESFLSMSDEELKLEKKLEESGELAGEITSQLRKDKKEEQPNNVVDSSKNKKYLDLLFPE